MASEITVGPPCLTINHGSTFMVTDRRGEIAPDQELGVFAQDTRFVGYYRWTIERQPWVLLTSSTTSYSEMRLVYTNPAMPALDDPLPGLPQGKGRTFPGVRGNIPANQLGLVLTRDVDGTIAESVVLTNYSDMAVRFHLDLSIRSDFVDLFDVKAHRYFSRGDSVSTWHAGDDHWDLVVNYREWRLPAPLHLPRDRERQPAALREWAHRVDDPHCAGGALVRRGGHAPRRGPGRGTAPRHEHPPRGPPRGLERPHHASGDE